MDDFRIPMAKPSSGPRARLISRRTAYLIGGASLGLAVDFEFVLNGGLGEGRTALWFLAVAPLFGALAGLELYLSRRWTRFGRFTPLIRFGVACASTAGLLSAVGAFVGAIPRDLVWWFTGGGALIGMLYGLDIFGARVENWPGGERWKNPE